MRRNPRWWSIFVFDVFAARLHDEKAVFGSVGWNSEWTSELNFECELQKTSCPSFVRRTPTWNRSSGSSNILVSEAGSVPSRCFQT